MDKATMSSIVGHLISLGIVEEVKPAQVENKPGRKPIGLGLIDDFGYVLGIEYHKNGLKAVLKDIHSKTVQVMDFPQKINKENIKSVFFTAYKQILKDLNGKPILGVGVAIPGIVNHSEGVIVHSRKLGIENDSYNFRKEVFENLDVPGFIDNDANCCAHGVLTDQRVKEYSNFLYTLINYEHQDDLSSNDESLGLGFGIVLNGKLYNGPDHTAGEFQTIDDQADRINQMNLNHEELDRFESDPALQLRVVLDLASHFALFVNVFNFQHIFLGGNIPALVPDLKEQIVSSIDKNWLYKNERTCGVHIQKSDEMSPALGAAGMFLDRLFTVPEMDHDRGAIIWQKIFSNRDLLDY